VFQQVTRDLPMQQTRHSDVITCFKSLQC